MKRNFSKTVTGPNSGKGRQFICIKQWTIVFTSMGDETAAEPKFVNIT
jgi:hypothetical protein